MPDNGVDGANIDSNSRGDAAEQQQIRVPLRLGFLRKRGYRITETTSEINYAFLTKNEIKQM